MKWMGVVVCQVVRKLWISGWRVVLVRAIRGLQPRRMRYHMARRSVLWEMSVRMVPWVPRGRPPGPVIFWVKR